MGKEYDQYSLVPQLRFEGEFFNNRIFRTKKTYPNGNIKLEIEYDNFETGKGKEYYENGKLKFEGEYYLYERKGEGKEYNIDGLLIFEGYYIGGKRNGEGKEYCYEYINGVNKRKLLHKGLYNNDILIKEK